MATSSSPRQTVDTITLVALKCYQLVSYALVSLLLSLLLLLLLLETEEQQQQQQMLQRRGLASHLRTTRRQRVLVR